MNGTTTLRILDFASDGQYDYSLEGAGAGTPLIKDLDHDGILEMVSCFGTQDENGELLAALSKLFECAEFWCSILGRYAGSFSTGQFRQSCLGE